MSEAATATTVILGQGPVANAIAGQLEKAGFKLLQVGLSGGQRVNYPGLTVPKQVWPLQAESVIAPQAPARVVSADDVKLGLTPEGKIQMTVAGEVLVPAHLIIASARAAAKLLPQLNLKLPLRPVRCHMLWIKGSPRIDEVTYLARGTVNLLSKPTAILYDGLLDPRQATFLPVPDLAVQSALEQWLAKRGTEPTGAPTVFCSATTPDYLPVFGQWPDHPQLWLATGWNVWGASVAGSVAAKLLDALKGDIINDVEISRLNPARFHIGTWEKADRPAWLPEHPQPQLVGGLKEVTRADTVNTIDTPKVERAGTVNTIDSPQLQRAGQVNTRSTSRPKVQAGGLAQMAKMSKS